MLHVVILYMYMFSYILFVCDILLQARSALSSVSFLIAQCCFSEHSLHKDVTYGKKDAEMGFGV